MSKAFTKDEGSAPLELVRRAPTRSGPRPITPEGHAALQTELEGLLARRAVTKASSALDATARTAELDARIALVQDTLAHVVIVRSDPESGRALLGALVELEAEDGERVAWRLVGPDEADAKAGRLSVESPLGRALLGKEADDEVAFERPRGRATFTIVAVRYAAA